MDRGVCRAQTTRRADPRVRVVGSVAATAYTASMQAEALGLPALPDAVRGAVNDNIGAAKLTSTELGPAGLRLTQIAQDAFVTSMGGALWVAAGVAVWATVIAVVHLPRRSLTAAVN